MQSSKSVPAFPKLPARYIPVVMPFILSVLMTFVVSLIATLKNLGFRADLLSHWMPAWGLSWIVAFPVLLLVLPCKPTPGKSVIRASNPCGAAPIRRAGAVEKHPAHFED